MIKGSIVLKPARCKKWVTIFRTWINSGHIAIVIHCKDRTQAKRVLASASTFKRNEGAEFWSHLEGNDIYLLRPDAIKNMAMEVEQRSDGMIYFFDSTKYTY